MNYYIWNGVYQETSNKKNIWIKKIVIHQLSKELVIELKNDETPINLITHPDSSWIREKLDEI